MYLILWINFLITIVFVNYCKGEIRFTCPKPQQPNSSLTTSPCGGGLNGSFSFEAAYTDVWPGLYTIRFEETTISPDTPFQVNLLDYTDSTKKCMLLDHVPHNNDPRTINTKDCNAGSYPIGGCNTATHLTVRIPDIACDKCVLQIIQILPEDGSKCIYGNVGFDCTTYYTCANIKIWPSSAGKNKDVSSCQNYFDSITNYPFNEVKVYWNVMTEPFAGGFVYLYDNDHNIKYNITSTTESPHISGLGLYERHDAGLPFFVQFNRVGDFTFAGNLNAYGVKKFREAIARNSVWLKVTYINRIYVVGAFQVTFKEKKFVRNQYEKFSTTYDAHGVVSHPHVSGENSRFAELAYPAGPCSLPSITTHGSILYSNDKPLGIVVLKWSGQKVYITAIFGNRETSSWEVVFKRPETIGRRRKTIVIPPKQIQENIVETTLPAWNFFLFAGTVPSTVKAADSISKLEMDGVVNRTIKAELRDKDGYLKGVCMVQITRTNLIQIVVMIGNYLARVPAPRAITINGPGTLSTTAPALYDLKPSLNFDTAHTEGIWVSKGLYGVTDSEVPLLFWMGSLYVNVVGTEEQFNLAGQFEPANKALCTGVRHVFCHTCELQNGKIKQDNKVYEVEYTSGRGTFHYNTDKGTIDMTFILQGLDASEKVTKAVIIMTREYADITLDVKSFQRVTYRSKTAVASFSVKRLGDMNNLLAAGLLRVRLHTTRGQSVTQTLSCVIPALRAPPPILSTTTRSTKKPTTTTPKPTTTTSTTTTTTRKPTTKPTTIEKTTRKIEITTKSKTPPIIEPSVKTSTTTKLKPLTTKPTRPTKPVTKPVTEVVTTKQTTVKTTKPDKPKTPKLTEQPTEASSQSTTRPKHPGPPVTVDQPSKSSRLNSFSFISSLNLTVVLCFCCFNFFASITA